MNRLTEYEIELMEQDLEEIGNRLDILSGEDAEIRDELLKNQQQIIKDLEIANNRLKEELRCEKRLNKFLSI